MAIDTVGTKFGGSTIKLPLDNPAVAEALRSGKASDLHKILTDYKITAADWEEFISGRGREYEESIVKSVSAYASDASAPEPTIDDIIPLSYDRKLDIKEREFLTDLMGVAMEHFVPPAASGGAAGGGATGEKSSAKAMKAATLESKGKAASTAKASGFSAELGEKIKDDVAGLDDLILRLESIDFYADLKRQSEAQIANIEREYQRIMAMARSGNVDPTVLVIAITKLNMEKNGVLFAAKAKEIMKINDDMNASFKIMSSSTSTTDPAKYYTAQGKIQEQSQSLKLVMEDMQAIVKATETASSTGKNMIEAIHSISMEMIRKTGAPSA